MLRKPLDPIHPGETILEDLLEPLGIGVDQLASALFVDSSHLKEIIEGERGVDADLASRLARFLGTSRGFWMRLQADYDSKAEG